MIPPYEHLPTYHNTIFGENFLVGEAAAIEMSSELKAAIKAGNREASLTGICNSLHQHLLCLNAALTSACLSGHRIPRPARILPGSEKAN